MAALISRGDYAVHARTHGATQLIFLNRKQSRMTDALNLMSPKQKGGKKSETETSPNRLIARAYENNFRLALFFIAEKIFNRLSPIFTLKNSEDVFMSGIAYVCFCLV